MTDDLAGDTSRILSQADQLHALIRATGAAFGDMHAALVDRKVPRHIAGKIVQDAAHQFYAGTWNKPAGLMFPPMH